MMIKRIPLIESEYPLFESLYLQSFPEEERRPIEKQRHFWQSKIEFKIDSIRNESDQFIGFISYWIFDDFTYLEHLATLPEIRGGGMGAKIVHSVIDTTNLPVWGECELPESELAIRRLDFYRRLGFTIHENYPYTQPAYADYLPAVPMYLISHNAPMFESKFEGWFQKLRIAFQG